MPLVVLVAGLVLAGLSGYLGYLAYPRFHLPSVAGTALLVLAAVAGVAAFFSPCSFPLLLTLLAREIRGKEGGRQRAGVALVFAGAFSAGAVAFVVLLGLLIALGGRGVAASITFTSPAGRAIRITMGLGLILLGLVQMERLPVSFHWVDRLTEPVLRGQARLRRDYPVAGFALFGFSYLIIGFG